MRTWWPGACLRGRSWSALLMRELGLEPCQPRPWRFSLTEGDGQEHGIPDLVDRDFTADGAGRENGRRH